MSTQTCEALVVNGVYQERAAIERPKPGPHQLLMRVAYAAQNPTDVQCLDNSAFGDGAVLGCDFVGTVEEIGEAVQRYSTGETVACLIWGGEKLGLGAYAEYCLADEQISFPVPQALFSRDCLNIPRDDAARKQILIWGGSSSVGLYAIQIASMYGMEIITTCSSRHFDLVKSFGAKYTFDYRDKSAMSELRRVATKVSFVFDTIGNSETSTTASQLITPGGGTLCTVRPGKAFTENVTEQTKVTDVLVWTAFLTDHAYKTFFWPASLDDHRLSTELFENLPKWLVDGKMSPNTTKVYGNGLKDVASGFQEYRDGKISGYKVVYRL